MAQELLPSAKRPQPAVVQTNPALKCSSDSGRHTGLTDWPEEKIKGGVGSFLQERIP